MADHADFYVYELNPENPRQYRYGGGWEDMRIVTRAHRGEGRGAARGRAGVHAARAGAEERAREEPRLRAAHRVDRHPGTSAYFGAARYQTAADWPTFRAALKHWGAAPMNFVYADVGGQHRLATGWLHPAPQGLGRPGRRARRRPLRVGRLYRAGGAADAAKPRARLDPDCQRDERAARSSGDRAGDRLRVGRPRPRRAHRRGAGRRPRDDRRRLRGAADGRRQPLGAARNSAADGALHRPTPRCSGPSTC